MGRKTTNKNTASRWSAFLLAFLFVCTDLCARPRAERQIRDREAVAIDCDTAITSDLRIVRRPYRLSDNLYWGINATGFHPIITQPCKYDFLQTLRPGGEFVFGKYFTPWVSAGICIGYSLQNEYSPSLLDGFTYTYHTAAATLEGQLCLNRLFSRYNPREKFSCYAVAGGGIQSAFAYKDYLKEMPLILDAGTKFSPYYRAGLMLEWHTSEKYSITTRGLWSATTKPICGLIGDHRHNGLEISLGFVCRLANHYAARTFQNCRGNEIYYFRYLEDHLLEDHQHQLKRHRKGKAEMPDMSAEQDSILIFPCGYPYLTARQEAKLELVAIRLSLNPHLVLVIDLYPIAVDDPKMTPMQSMQRAEDAIRSYLLHSEHKVNRNQMRFHLHDEPSPVPNQSIWIHGAFLSFIQ